LQVRVKPRAWELGAAAELTWPDTSATSSTMTRIGIRELRQRASEFLRRVEAGETIEVTDRGRPIALLTPIPAAPPIERLRASGDIEGGVTDWDDLPSPLDLEPGQESPSTVLERLRSDER